MLFSLAYVAFVSLLRLLILSGRSAQHKDVELLVLRHQLDVLRRQVERPKLRSSDRALLAAMGPLLPPQHRQGLLVTPQTLLRWHRQLVRRRWTYGRAKPGRPPLGREAQHEPAEPTVCRRPARAASSVSPTPRHDPTMPTQQRVGCD
jgi:putative transposase